MKKLGILVVTVLIAVLWSCEKEDANAKNDGVNSQNSLSNRIWNGNEIIINGAPGERGEAGPGYWGPNTVPFNNCNQPDGICLYHKGIGGGGRPTWRAELISVDKLRFSFIEARNINHEDLVSSLSLENTMQGFDLEMMANFIETHFNIPNRKSFEGNVNQQILDQLGINDKQVFAEPGEYEIITNEENPNGYFDVDITVE